jgi:putative phosphoesterase
MRVGVVSDTHGLLRPEAVQALRGSDLIVHAGDVGNPSIIDELATLAPVRAVRGNVDRGPWALRLPLAEVVEVERCQIYVLHILDDLDLDPEAAGFGVVIFGHSHRPLLERRRGVLYLNPGSAGPRRFDLPVTVARLIVDGSDVDAQIVELDVAPPAEDSPGR